MGPESDVAMTELFRRLSAGFLCRLPRARAGDPAFTGVRKTLYSWYHVINHANLFGGAPATGGAR